VGRHRTAEEKIQLGEQARAKRAAGKSRREIEVELGIGDDLANELLRGTEVPDSLRRPRAKDDLRMLARDMYVRGQSYREIERELGVARSSLSLWLRDLKDGAAPVAGDSTPAASVDSRVALARELRAEGWLIKDIAEQLGLSTVAVHRWVRDLPIPKSARPGGDPAHMHRMRRAYWDPVLEAREAERQQTLAAAAAEVGPISARDLVVLAAVAYWCEGTKSKPWLRREFVHFINSDAGLILLFLAFLRGQGVADSQLRLCVSIHESADVAAAERYWADLIGIPVEVFRPANLKKHNPKTVRKNTGQTYVGCLSIGVRQSRELYQRIAGSWQGIIESVGAQAAAA
jgi:transposase